MKRRIAICLLPFVLLCGCAARTVFRAQHPLVGTWEGTTFTFMGPSAYILTLAPTGRYRTTLSAPLIATDYVEGDWSEGEGRTLVFRPTYPSGRTGAKVRYEMAADGRHLTLRVIDAEKPIMIQTWNMARRE